MAPDVGELVAALPQDLDEERGSAMQGLQDLLMRLAHKPVPVGRLTRMWTLGSMKAKIAVAYLAYWIRSSYATKDEKEKQLNETHLKAALQLLGGMSYMRGAIMKVGQTLAQYPQIVPSQFVELLGKLHFEAPPMHYSLLREYLHNELGADPEELFAEFETAAFAAASLGQVHRARLKSGELVAVKVQYPNIARTIESDFRNFMAMMAPMRLSKDWDNIRAQWEDVRQMLTWETDYEREADFLRRARAVFGEDEGIVVPNVYPEYSTKHVLTMDYLDGVHVDEYLADNPLQEQRDRYGELIMRASFRVAHAAKLWYADSNPGNYVFMRDGRLGLLDFGCCREFSESEWDYYKLAIRGYQERGAALHEVLTRATGAQAGRQIDPEHMKHLVEYFDWFNEYFLHEGPFDFGNEQYIQRGIDLISRMGRKRYFQSLPVNTWITRHVLGLRAMCYKLRARIDMKTLNEQESQGLFS